ncbi:uncharacterized protein AstC isoform X2 [Bactrocera oleae]|uniref:uncharacterized protein AstC isoform X2 n=1 Tax=Bactrocera oleae TaxID=104688 RepID=UPI0006B7688E|nr:uncharacterized protein LOC106614956 isoform X2 [Bactrocera oleae]
MQCFSTLSLKSCGRRRPFIAKNDINIIDLDNFGQDVDEVRNTYYELPVPSTYSAVPFDRLQMLIAQYRPTSFDTLNRSYIRTPGWSSGMNELFRMPETKRQVRYRQCYFNPISCFKK